LIGGCEFSGQISKICEGEFAGVRFVGNAQEANVILNRVTIDKSVIAGLAVMRLLTVDCIGQIQCWLEGRSCGSIAGKSA
jgi:hypothetical protein